MVRNSIDANELIGETLPGFERYKVVDKIGSGANGDVYRARAVDIEADLAFKFVPRDHLPTSTKDRDLYLAEARNANTLENTCVVQCIDVRFFNDKHGREFIVFVSQYVDGPTLARFMKSRRREIGMAFIEQFLRTMFSLLFELDERGMTHGDLHPGNVLVTRSRYDLSAATTFKVTDFSIVDITGIEQVNDYYSVGEILRGLLACINYQQLQSRDRYVFDILRREFLGRHLMEADPTADPVARNPRDLNEKLRSLDDQFRHAAKLHSVTSMVTPFDYPNCEQMGNSHLLLKNLYSDRLLGLSEIRAKSNLVLTGPRGCGKTTVFRALSLDYLLTVEEDNPKDLDFLGVYYRCDDLYFSFPRYRLPERSEALDIPVHFLAVTLMAETLKGVSEWGERYFEEELLDREKEVVRALRDVLELRKPEGPTADSLASLINLLNQQRNRAAKKQRVCHQADQQITGYLGPRSLFDFCAALRSGLSFMKERPIFFFIDDYSSPKITPNLQRNLNRMVMHRCSDVYFKLSTESPISFARSDVDGKQYVEEREYELLNLGLRYLKHEGTQIGAFLQDLFQRRFTAVENFPSRSLTDLLGDKPRNENETARLIRERKAANSYCGCQTVIAMCSGDIHYIIRLVGRMVEDAGGIEFIRQQTSEPQIPFTKQSSTIRTAAGEFMESVRNLPRHGERLANIVTAIGNVSRSYLQHRNSGNQKGNPPHQASRIEPYEPLNLSSTAQEILGELLRFSILLMDPRGKSRRGELVPRFYLRRYLIPHFNLTFSKRDSIELENVDIELLLTEPDKFREVKRIKGTEDRRSIVNIATRQEELSFPDGDT